MTQNTETIDVYFDIYSWNTEIVPIDQQNAKNLQTVRFEIISKKTLVADLINQIKSQNDLLETNIGILALDPKFP